MADLKQLLFWCFAVFTLVCLALMVEAHFRYRNRTGIDKDQDFQGRYRYFVQSIYDEQHKIIGYELLLRSYNAQEKKWELPKHVDQFPLSLAAQVMIKMVNRAENVNFLAINMTISQLSDFRAERFFNWVLGNLDSQRLEVELNADRIVGLNFWQRLKLRRIMHKFSSIVDFTIEGVDSSDFMYKKIRPLLPATTFIKFNVNAFHKSPDHWIDITLAQWQRIMKEYKVRPILGRIESQEEIELANQLGIDRRQGFAYGSPQKI